MNRLFHVAVLISLVSWITACAPASQTTPSQTTPSSQQRMPERTLVIVSAGEPPSIAAKSLVNIGFTATALSRIFNATLDYVDEHEAPQPHLAEAVPQANTDSWRIFADGSMETTYRLRPNLTWHDGAPLSSEDFVFAWQIYSTPELGVARSLPLSEMAEVLGPDPQTVVIKWKGIYVEATSLDLGFQALPRHILAEGFRGLDFPSIANHPFWTRDYVGLGPYRISQWEPGSFIAGTAFDGYSLGRPKIDQIRVVFIGDSNTALATMLSGDAHFAASYALYYEQAATLEREWAARGRPGTILYAPTLLRTTSIQSRPEYVDPKELFDVRVRKAIAHGIDAPGVIDATSGGRGLVTYSLTSPLVSYYGSIERAVEKRPYDPRLTHQHLEQAGLVPGADGFYARADGSPLRVEVHIVGGATNQQLNAIFVDGLRRAGVDAYTRASPVAQASDAESRNKLPALDNGGGGATPLKTLTSAAVPRPDNRWLGNNRGGWTTAAYDRLYDVYARTFDRPERIQQIAQLEQIVSENVGVIPNHFDINVYAYAGSLKGPVIGMTPDAGTGILHIEKWEWIF